MKRKDFIEWTDKLIKRLEKGELIYTCNYFHHYGNSGRYESLEALEVYETTFSPGGKPYYIPAAFEIPYDNSSFHLISCARIFAVKWFQLLCLEDGSYKEF